jgi:hypothetical protein
METITSGSSKGIFNRHTAANHAKSLTWTMSESRSLTANIPPAHKQKGINHLKRRKSFPSMKSPSSQSGVASIKTKHTRFNEKRKNWLN